MTNSQWHGRPLREKDKGDGLLAESSFPTSTELADGLGLEGLPWLDELLFADPRGPWSQRWFSVAWQLRRRGVELAVLFPNSFRSGLVAWLVLTPAILGVLILMPWRRLSNAQGIYVPVLWGVGAAFVVILVHGLVDSPYWKNDLSLEFWLLAALEMVALRALAQPVQTTPATPAVPPRRS